MRLRSKAREVALCILYQMEITKRDWESLLTDYLENEEDPPKGMIDFARLLLGGIHRELTSLDGFIRKYAKNWELERMAIIDRNILRMGIFELAYLGDIPPKVSINEEIELAKRYGDKDSPRFVNGILDKVYKVGNEKHREVENESEKNR